MAKPRLATKKQLAYARRLGFSVSDDITFDGIKKLLDDFDSVKFYFFDVFKATCKKKSGSAGISSADFNPIVVQIVKDRRLFAHIDRIEETRYETGAERSEAAQEAYERGMGPEPVSFDRYMPGRPKDWAYRKVAEMIESRWPRLVRKSFFEKLTGWFGG